MCKTILGVLLALAAMPALAGECGKLPRMHALDFWLGHWDVFEGGQLVGTNFIEPSLDGCAVLEHWTEQGGAGTSLFYYDVSTDRWKQVWVTDQALHPGGMKEKVEQIDFTAAGRIRFRGRDRTTLTRETDGKVRQVIESTPDGGKTWHAVFDAIYKPSPAGSAAACSSSRDAIAAAPLRLIDNNNRRDVEGVLAGYTDDAVWLSPDQPPVHGRSNFRPRYESLFHDNKLEYSAEIGEAHSDGTLGYAWGTIHGTSTPLDGSPARSVDDTFLAITRCESGRWLVSHLIWSHARR
ncbi:MAG TPA: nuclear transport factor 2 family protein [Steroidobacteraceae bacterium]|jgi:ketosteroid isomerase-like protein